MDAMQEVFIKVQKNLKSFRSESSPLTWIQRIATNHCYNVIRAKKAAWHDKYRSEVKTKANATEVTGADVEREELLRLALTGCKPEIAEVAVYYFVDEMTQKEITDLVGISAPTLRKRLRAFIESARTEIQKVMPDVEFEAPPI
jgi:RNA polymerase sigma-70 factor (ECF subfamily)